MNGRKPGVNPAVLSTAGLSVLFWIGLFAAGPLLAVGLPLFVTAVMVGVRVIVTRTEAQE